MNSILSQYREAYRGISRDVWFLSITLLINRCGSMVLAFLSLYLIEARGYAESLTGVAFAVFGFGSIAGAYLGGRFTEQYGAIRIMTLCTFLSVPAFLIIPFCTSFLQVMLALFFLSLTSEAVRPANATAVALFTKPENQTKAFALQRLAVNLGLSIGPAVGGFLAEYDFDLLFWVDGVSTMAGAIALLLFFRFRRFTSEFEEKQTQDRVANNTTYRSPIFDWQFATLIGLILIVAICFFQYHVTYPLYLRQQYSMNKWTIGLLFAVNTVMVVLFEMVLVDYAKRWSKLRAIGWGCFLVCLGFGILPWGAGILPFDFAVGFCVISAVILTMGEMLSMPIASGWIAERSQGKNQGVYMGWYSMTYSVACVVGPVMGSMIYSYNPDLIWDLSLIAGFVVAIGFYFFIRAVEAEKRAIDCTVIETNEPTEEIKAEVYSNQV